jgi:hypothetical protein
MFSILLPLFFITSGFADIPSMAVNSNIVKSKWHIGDNGLITVSGDFL